MNDSHSKLREFQKWIAELPTNPHAESLVREVIARAAQSLDAPKSMLVDLANVLVQHRLAELKDQASRN